MKSSKVPGPGSSFQEPCRTVSQFFPPVESSAGYWFMIMAKTKTTWAFHFELREDEGYEYPAETNESDELDQTPFAG